MTLSPDTSGKAYLASRSTLHASRFTLGAAGFTLVEAVVALLIVGTMLVAALTTVGASRLSQLKTSQQSRGQQLAADLMAEIIRAEYEDPSQIPQFGTEPGETGSGRDLFDDVDDYNGWSASPPEYEDGTAIPGLTGWERSVAVAWVDPTDPNLVQGSETGAKRIIVTVSWNDIPAGSVTAVRTASGL